MADDWSKTAQADAGKESSHEDAGAISEPCPLHDLDIELIDADGQPVAGEPYVVKMADGPDKTGRLDSRGWARVTGLTRGAFAVTFPNRQVLDLADKRTWFEFGLQDFQGKPMRGARYELFLPNGETRTGRTDKNGNIRVADVYPGICRIVFPDFPAAPPAQKREEES